MGKQGPCYHCGVTSTPLWRNGPPEKPVLCNACGSRWRTKGTLANYTPLHARAEPDDLVDQKVTKMKSISMNKNREVKPLKRKYNHDFMVVGGVSVDYNQGFRKVVDEETSNRSSSGSAISNSESCAQFGSADASDLTGPAQSMVWDTTVPSRKRTCVGRPKQSPVEKLTKDLYTILHEQQSSYFSGSSEEDLLFESETPMVSVEIGHGSVLIRHPSSIAREEESEASSLSIDNRQSNTNEVYSHSAFFDANSRARNFTSLAMDKMNTAAQSMPQESLKRYQHENLQTLTTNNSQLCHVDLSDILNFEEFARHLTNEEQQQLLKYLCPVDTIKLPDSVKSLFDSPQFKENLTSFQQLLSEGIFDSSFSGAKTEDCKTLKRLALFNLSKCKWIERYQLLKSHRRSPGGSNVYGPIVMNASNNVINVKRFRGGQNQNFQEVKVTMKSPKRVIMKGNHESKELIVTDSDGSCFSPRSLFALPSEGSSFMMDSINFVGESSDQDLLLDVPSNGSFAQAELLHPTLSFASQQASTSSSSIYPHLVNP